MKLLNKYVEGFKMLFYYYFFFLTRGQFKKFSALDAEKAGNFCSTMTSFCSNYPSNKGNDEKS